MRNPLTEFYFSLQKATREKEEPEYVLKWSEHNLQLLSVFQQLWEDHVFTDVTLMTETKSFEAHKLILSACSPYFRSLFMDNPCKHPIVFLKVIHKIMRARQSSRVKI